MIEAVLFDLDGTLINTNNLIIRSFQYTFRNVLQKEISDEEIVKYFGEPLIVTMSRFDSKNPEKLVEAFREFNEKSHDQLAKSFDGANEALNLMKNRNIKIAVVTSKRKIMAERGLKLFGLYNYIDVLVTPEYTLRHKPDGEPAVLACHLMNVDPENAIMVGDSHNDILCGQNAGCSTCLVSYTELPLEKVKDCKPDYIIDNLLELDEIIFHNAKEA